MAGVELSKILKCDGPSITTFPVCYRNHKQVVTVHKIEHIPYGHLHMYRQGLSCHYILNPHLHVWKIERFFYAKGIEDKLGLNIYIPGPCGDYMGITCKLFELGIGDGSTDGISIRVT